MTESNATGHGALRDTLGAVTNLERLLSSRNVAPKAISQVLPDVQTCCRPLLAEVGGFCRELATKLDPAVILDLGSFIREQVERLDAATSVASKRQVNASVRLKLEREVVAVSRNLAGALPLTELLVGACQKQQPTIDLLELLRLSRSGDQPQTPGARVIQAGLFTEVDPLLVRANPRAMISLIGLCAAVLNVREAAAPVAVKLSLAPDGTAQTRLINEQLPGKGFRVLLPPVVPPTAACIETAARGLGLDLLRTDESLCLSWSAIQAL